MEVRPKKRPAATFDAHIVEALAALGPGTSQGPGDGATQPAKPRKEGGAGSGTSAGKFESWGGFRFVNDNPA